MIEALRTGLYSTLAGGTALTALLSGTTAVYYLEAPDSETLPYVVYSGVAGGPMNITPSDIRDNVVYVRGYAYRPDTAGSIDAAISNLLHGHTLTVSGYTNWRTIREEEIEVVEVVISGERVYSAGANYRISLDS